MAIPLKVETWYDLYPTYVQALAMQNFFVRFFGVCFLLLVACFIAFMMWVIVKEKRRDIGILKAVGAPTGPLVGVFLILGLAIGILGTAPGLLAGWALQANINTIAPYLGLDFIHRVLMDLPEFRTRMSAWDVCFISTITVGLSLLASQYPVYVAAQVDPIETLRRE